MCWHGTNGMAGQCPRCVAVAHSDCVTASLGGQVMDFGAADLPMLNDCWIPKSSSACPLLSATASQPVLPRPHWNCCCSSGCLCSLLKSMIDWLGDQPIKCCRSVRTLRMSRALFSQLWSSPNASIASSTSPSSSPPFSVFFTPESQFLKCKQLSNATLTITSVTFHTSLLRSVKSVLTHEKLISWLADKLRVSLQFYFLFNCYLD